MISRTVQHALRILGHLAARGGQWVQAHEIARSTGIPANYLSKILNQLRKAGFVDSQKGWGGGFVLREDARDAPIRRVLELFDGRTEIHQCPFGFPGCTETEPCPLHVRWAPVAEATRRMLEETTIDDLRELK